jgi:hypothetical protein
MRAGAVVVLRSKSPPMIRQEIYAMLCCYQEMACAANVADAGYRVLRVTRTAWHALRMARLDWKREEVILAMIASISSEDAARRALVSV